MKHNVFALILPAAILFSGCSSTPMPTSAPTLPPDATARFTRTDVFCPTENEQARQFYNDAVELQERGEWEQAKQSFLKAIEQDPGYCDAMDNLGQLLRSQGNVEQAIHWYKKSIEVLPSNVVAHQNLAFAYEIQGKITEAIAEYQLLVQIDPDNPEGYYGLGSICLSLGQPQEAVTQLKKAEELYSEKSSPLIVDARKLLGASYYVLEDYEKARDYFELIYPDLQDDPNVNFYLGLCYISPEIENLELAERYLRRAQELGVDIPTEVLRKLDE